MIQRVETLMERYHSMFVWYIATRYVVIGLEYLFLLKVSSLYWNFSNLSPRLVGSWMLITGLLGAASRLSCYHCWTKQASVLTGLFLLGVVSHSLFRLTGFAQRDMLGDPLSILFICDLGWAIWLKFQLRKWIYCA